MSLTKEQIKELREDAHKIIEYQQPTAVKVYDRVRQNGAQGSYARVSATDWFLLEVMCELSGRDCNASWFEE